MNTQLAERAPTPVKKSSLRAAAASLAQPTQDPPEDAGLLCTDAQAQAELGMALMQAGSHAQAAEVFCQAIRLQPEWTQMHAMLAIALQAGGRLEAAVEAYRQALAIEPGDAQSQSNLGVLLQTLGRSEEAVKAFRLAIEADPRRAEAHANLGVTLRAQGHIEPAIQALRQAVALKPNYAEAHANLGSCHQALGQWEAAATSLRVATILHPGYADAFHNLAVVMVSLHRPAEAASASRSAISLGVETADVYLVMGVALQELGQQDEAVAAYRRAIDIDPASADAYSNLGVVLLEQSKSEAAEAAFRKAIALHPDHPHACANLSIALHEQGKDAEAAQCFERAVQISPDDADIYSNFAMVRIHQSQFDDALRLLAQAAELNQNHGRPLADPRQVPLHRIKHDHEQMQWLRSRQLLGPEFEAYAAFLEAMAQRLGPQADTTQTLTLAGDELAQMAPSYNRLVHVPRHAEIARPYLNPALDVAQLEQDYLNSKPEVMWIDDFLSPAALSAIRDFCLEATVWKKEYPNGYLGATLKDGFASPLLLQIAEELRTKFPNIFQKHLLEQAWAFKYDSTMKGINVHADFAAVNINFWITPDEACRNPDNGGLIVWDKAAPRDWSFQKYNGDEAQIRRFLSQSGAKAIRIPYRANRCVVFNSTLFHETDRFEFNDAYPDRRVNVTLLYGKGLKMR
jgi:Tfp pilus assembly protein PilF